MEFWEETLILVWLVMVVMLLDRVVVLGCKELEPLKFKVLLMY